MKLRTVLSAPLILCATICSATNLQAIIEPFAVPAKESYSAADWSAVERIPGVKWPKKGPTAARGDFSKFGSATLDKHGNVSVYFKGPRTMVVEGSVSIQESDGKIFEKEEFDKVLKAQFSNDTQIKKLRSVCAADKDGISGNSIYEVILKDKKPIFFFVWTDSGGNSAKSRGSSFDFSIVNEARWKC